MEATEPVTKPGNRRGRRSRDEILATAARLMAERGYAAMSLSELARESGLPKSGVYHHFQSKGGLLSAVMERGANDFFEAMRQAHANPLENGTYRDRLDWYLQRTAEVFLSHQDFLRLHLILLMSAEAEEPEIVAGMIRSVRHEGRLYMRQLIASAFATEGDETAARIAAELDYFAIAGFDGAFIAMQAEPSRSIVDEMHLLTEAIAALGAARLSRWGT